MTRQKKTPKPLQLLPLVSSEEDHISDLQTGPARVFFLNTSLIADIPKYFSLGGVEKGLSLLGPSETISSCRTER